MDCGFSILIADKNRNVRDFLRREFELEGYSVVLAGNHKEIFDCLNSTARPDLLILDLDIPYTGGLDVLMRIDRELYSLSIIVYTILTEYEHHPIVMKADAFVEKKGNPSFLKLVVSDVLRKRFASEAMNGESHQLET